ncbi:MAG: CARDB domain-containing protein [Candidatus Altarchaeum sp.]|nr:CARDB domain-containing protein [Candidatus Altarchaeum sp.]
MINLKASLLGIIIFCVIINLAYALPDLVAEIDYYPKNVTVGDNVTVVQTIKNIGEINLTHIGIGYRTVSGQMMSAKSYPPSGINLSANSEINFTFNFIIRYGKFTVETIADCYNTVNETNEDNNNVTLIFDFPILVKTDKKVYKIGEIVNINIIGNWSDSIQVMYNYGDPFNIFRFENNTWNRLQIKQPFQSPRTCKNGTLQYGGLGDPIFWNCYISSVNFSLSWDQTEYNLVNLTCGNTT